MQTKLQHSEGYLLRARKIQEIDKKYYQPYQDSCHKMVWQKYVYPEFGCGYRAFLRYLKADPRSCLNAGRTVPERGRTSCNETGRGFPRPV